VASENQARLVAEAGREQWPEPRETREHFLERCVAGLMAGGMSRDKADEVCSAKWRDAQKGLPLGELLAVHAWLRSQGLRPP